MALWDLANSDVIVVMGSNMAENHPIGFRFVMQAKARGATLIHIDPRQFIYDRDQNRGVLETAKAQLTGQKLGAEIAGSPVVGARVAGRA